MLPGRAISSQEAQLAALGEKSSTKLLEIAKSAAQLANSFASSPAGRS